jgi:methionyl aminopeptidase
VIVRKSEAEIRRIAAAGTILADCLDMLAAAVSPGVRTLELDGMAEEFIRGRGGTPTFLGYRGFPGSICASPNDMVVHGIPGSYVVADGDLLSLDVGVTLVVFVA